MTIEQATKYLYEVHATTKNESFAAALACAIVALKTKNPILMLYKWREDCPFCRRESGDDGIEIRYISSLASGAEFKRDHAIFCPRCGRPLTKLAWDRLLLRLGEVAQE